MRRYVPGRLGGSGEKWARRKCGDYHHCAETSSNRLRLIPPASAVRPLSHRAVPVLVSTCS